MAILLSKKISWVLFTCHRKSIKSNINLSNIIDLIRKEIKTRVSGFVFKD